MPWKFIIFLLICIILTFFMAANLENKVNLSFIFISFSQVPIFLVVIFSFIAGALITLLAIIFSFSQRKKKKKLKEAKEAEREVIETDNDETKTQRIEKRNAKKRR